MSWLRCVNFLLPVCIFILFCFPGWHMDSCQQQPSFWYSVAARDLRIACLIASTFYQDSMDQVRVHKLYSISVHFTHQLCECAKKYRTSVSETIPPPSPRVLFLFAFRTTEQQLISGLVFFVNILFDSLYTNKLANRISLLFGHFPIRSRSLGTLLFESL